MKLPTLPQAGSVAIATFAGAALPYLVAHGAGLYADWRGVLGGAVLVGVVALVHLYSPSPSAPPTVLAIVAPTDPVTAAADKLVGK